MTTARSPRRRRPNGEGSAYKVPTPAGFRWDIKITDENGRRISRRYKTEKAARDALKAAVVRKESGRSVVPVRHTMSQLFDAWLTTFERQVELGERSYHTFRDYRSTITQHMRPAVGGIDVHRLTVKAVEDYLSGLVGLSAKTRSNHRIILRRALNVALKWGWVDQNVVIRTDPIPIRHREVPPLSPDDAKVLLAALESDKLSSAFVVALYTGLRAGEIAGLRVEDVDLGHAAVRVHQQVQPVRGQLVAKPLKSYASAGSLDLVSDAVTALADAIGDRTKGYVWESAPGRPYWPTSITAALTRACQRAGLPHMHFHDLRHYFISFLPALDVHPKVAQRLARHANIGTTMNVYTSVEDVLAKQAIGRLGGALSSPTGRATGRSEEEKLRILR